MRLSRVTAGFQRLGAQFADVLLTEYTSISVVDVIKYIFVRNGLTATSGCSAAGSAPALGAGCREFKSLHSDQITQVRTLVVQKCICDTDEDAAEIKIFAVFSFSQIEKPPASAHTVAIAQGFCFFSVFELQYV